MHSLVFYPSGSASTQILIGFSLHLLRKANFQGITKINCIPNSINLLISHQSFVGASSLTTCESISPEKGVQAKEHLLEVVYSVCVEVEDYPPR